MKLKAIVKNTIGYGSMWLGAAYFGSIAAHMSDPSLIFIAMFALVAGWYIMVTDA